MSDFLPEAEILPIFIRGEEDPCQRLEWMESFPCVLALRLARLEYYSKTIGQRE
jgi:hypothetical protein